MRHENEMDARIGGAHDDGAGGARAGCGGGRRAGGQGGRLAGTREQKAEDRLARTLAEEGIGGGAQAREDVAERGGAVGLGVAAELRESIDELVRGFVAVEPGSQPDGRILQWGPDLGAHIHNRGSVIDRLSRYEL